MYCRTVKRATWLRPVLAAGRWAAGLVVLAGLSVAGAPIAHATDPSGLTSTMVAKGTFADDIAARINTDVDPNAQSDVWRAWINTKGASDLEVLQNTFAPGGTIGWHSHPGPSLVIVKAGTATLYMGDDHTCTPHVVPAGSGFVDSGADVHVVRNEGSEELVVVVASLIPAGATRRIDQPRPGHCGF
jgi:quercetin dioxygenase-like cupin family protein